MLSAGNWAKHYERYSCMETVIPGPRGLTASLGRWECPVSHTTMQCALNVICASGGDLKSHRVSEEGENISGFTEEGQIELGFGSFSIYFLGIFED